ncbi:hypothetical protein EDB85DRAFT_1949295 [Lactarius pseudohatsudake]|nr:hypothetical protein EDB85DRAFT_1949295 [Lactarius pseudohatsudake]
MILQYYPQLEHGDQDIIHDEFEKARDENDIGRWQSLCIQKVFLGQRLQTGREKPIHSHRECLSSSRAEKSYGSVFGDPCRERYARVLAHLLVFTVNTNLLATQPPPMGTTSTHSNPFSDSHAACTLTQIDVGNLNQLDVSTYHSEARGEAAVVLGLQGQDATTQEVLAVIPLEVFSRDRTGEEAETHTVSSYDTVGHGLYGTEVGDHADR